MEYYISPYAVNSTEPGFFNMVAAHEAWHVHLFNTGRKFSLDYHEHTATFKGMMELKIVGNNARYEQLWQMGVHFKWW